MWPVCLAVFVALLREATSLTAPHAVQTAPPRTANRTARRKSDSRDNRDENKFEYFVDPDARRNADGYHLLLLGETFKKPRMTVPYAAGALVMCIGMNEPDAIEHSQFAAENGMSCLGNWERGECLKLADQCSQRDLSVRVVPGIRGKQPWQGVPANSSPEGLPHAN